MSRGVPEAIDTTVSAYDLLPEADRAALDWVREHGELDEVRQYYECGRNIEPWNEQKADLYELMHECSDVDGIRKRLMPEGMEWLVEAWPRFEDDAPVRLLDDFERYGDENGVSAVTMYSDGSFALNCRAYSKGERVKRPAPKVLDADGAEIREKRDVWWICEGDERGIHAERLRVETILPDGLVECSPYNGGTWVYLEPSELYVSKPAIAADGKPLREGETVYHVNSGIEYSVRSVTNGGAHLSKGDKPGGYCRADYLTHERPDSWGRLEEDAHLSLDEYHKKHEGRVGHPIMSADMCVDLVRRARALAERGAR